MRVQRGLLRGSYRTAVYTTDFAPFACGLEFGDDSAPSMFYWHVLRQECSGFFWGRLLEEVYPFIRKYVFLRKNVHFHSLINKKLTA